MVFDFDASSTSTNDKDDFIPGYFKEVKGVNISGIASGLMVIGNGSISWKFCTNKGEKIDLTVDKVWHVPDLPTKLLSPQKFC